MDTEVHPGAAVALVIGYTVLEAGRARSKATYRFGSHRHGEERAKEGSLEAPTFKEPVKEAEKEVPARGGNPGKSAPWEEEPSAVPRAAQRPRRMRPGLQLVTSDLGNGRSSQGVGGGSGLQRSAEQGRVCEGTGPKGHSACPGSHRVWGGGWCFLARRQCLEPSWGPAECLNPCSPAGPPSALFFSTAWLVSEAASKAVLSSPRGFNDAVDGKRRPLAHRSDVRDKEGGEEGAS